jgi:hypothetical protein
VMGMNIEMIKLSDIRCPEKDWDWYRWRRLRLLWNHEVSAFWSWSSGCSIDGVRRKWRDTTTQCHSRRPEDLAVVLSSCINLGGRKCESGPHCCFMFSFLISSNDL